MEEIFKFIMEDAAPIMQGLLAGLGALKLLARYTPWQGDDKILAAIEKPMKAVAAKLPKRKK
jgi:hypothetical protein